MSLHNEAGHPLIKQGWARALLLFIVYLLASALIGVAIDWYAIQKAPGTKPEDRNILYLLIIVVSALSVITVLFFRKYIDRRPLNTIRLSLSLFYPDGVIGFLAGIFLICAGAVVIYLTGGLQWTGIAYNNDIFLNAFLLLLVAFSEELVFRWYILRNLMKSFGQRMSLLISACLFALVHLMNPDIPVTGIVNIILGGLVLGIAFIGTRNLWMPVLFHFSWNFFQGPVLGFPVSGLSFKTILSTSLSGNDLFNGGHFGFEGSIICTILLLAAFLVLFFSNRFGDFRGSTAKNSAI